MSLGVHKDRDALIDLFTRYPTTCLLFVYLMASVLLTWPLVLNLSSTLFGDYGDSRGGVWLLWCGLNGILDGPINQMVAAPFGVPANYGYNQPVVEWMQKLFAIFSNEIAAYNLVIVFAFPLTAIATYLFIDSLLQNKSAAFFGGLIFGFCPGAVMQAAGGHAAFAFNVFIPVFMLALFYNRTQRTLFSALYVGASFALITLTALYFGYFAIYIAIYFVFFDLLSSKGEGSGPILRNYFYAAIFAAVLILPFEYGEIYHQITSSANALKTAGRIRDLGELVAYSSRPWDFFIPSIDHPILGRYFYEFVRSHLHGSNVFEQTLYLGMVPLVFLLTGVVLAIRNKFVIRQRMYFLFFTFGALLMYFLSLPPHINVGAIQVPTLSFFAHKIAPMFRVYARFGILVNFFVACAVAVTLAHLYQSMKRSHYFAMLMVLLPLLVFEYWSIPFNYGLSVARPPEVYRWLAQQPGDFIVAEYPMMNSDEAAFLTYLFWQRIHKKRLANGASRGGGKAWDFFEKVKYLDNPNTAEQLQSAGIKYVVVHGDAYQAGSIPPPIKRYYSGDSANATYNGGRIPAIPFPLKLVKRFGSDFVLAWDEGKN